MRPEELMIGDWFQNPLGFPYKVKSIKCYNADKEDEHYEVYGANKSAEASFDVINAEPIPLTPEILEKNGFEQYGWTGWWLEDDYYNVNAHEISDSIWVVRYECTEMNTPYTQATIGYIHELQHALRLCGIEKEIVL